MYIVHPTAAATPVEAMMPTQPHSASGEPSRTGLHLPLTQGGHSSEVRDQVAARDMRLYPLGVEGSPTSTCVAQQSKVFRRWSLAQAAVVLLAMVASSFADQYPYLYIVPSEPTTADSVVLHVVLGENGSNCVPDFVGHDTSYYQPRPNLLPPPYPIGYPPAHIIEAWWEGPIAPARDSACRPVPTEVGPVIALGRLEHGSYRVLAAETTLSFDVTHPLPSSVVGGISYSQCAGRTYGLTDVGVWLEQITTDGIDTSIVPLDSCVTSSEHIFYEFAVPESGPYRILCHSTAFRPCTTLIDMGSRDTVHDIGLFPLDATATVKGSVIACSANNEYEAVPCSVTVSFPEIDTAVALWATGLGSYELTIPLLDTAQRVRITAHASEDSAWVDTLVRCGATLKHSFIIPGDCSSTPPPLTEVRYVDGVECRLEILSSAVAFDTLVYVSARYTITNVSDSAVSFALDRVCQSTKSPSTSSACWMYGVDAHTTSGELLPYMTSCIGYTCDSTRTTITLAPQERLPRASPTLFIDSTVDTAVVGMWLQGYPQTKVTATVCPEGISAAQAPSPGGGAHGLDRHTTREQRLVVSADTRGTSLTLRLRTAEVVSVRVWSLGGRLLDAPLIGRHMARGTHRILLAGTRAAGSRVLDVRIGQAGVTQLLPATACAQQGGRR